MRLSIYFFCCFLLSCNLRKPSQRLIIKNVDGINFKGEIDCDSLFNGVVKYYDSSNTYLGYGTYKHGYSEGVAVNYFKNGRIYDSSFFRNNMRNGFAYQFYNNGILEYKVFYLNDRPFGHMFEYDKSGNVQEYHFVNFEGKIIFENFMKDSVEYWKGEQIQANIYSEAKDTSNDYLFLYLFASPFVDRHYEIGILDSANKIVSSKPILSKKCFYEQKLTRLPMEEKYAVILHSYNKFKKRDDLKIRIIE